jgi:hypothetical protein
MAYDPEGTDEAAALENIVGRTLYFQAQFPDFPAESIAALVNATTVANAEITLVTAVDALTTATEVV